MGEVVLVEWIQAGGDMATAALAFFMWRIERRLLLVEKVVERLDREGGQ